MPRLSRLSTLTILLIAASSAAAQPPPPPGGRGGGPGGGGPGNDDTVARMMAFDKDKDGKLTKSEIGDDRLLRLFDRADADKDGAVTEAELTALVNRERSTGRGPGGPGGPMGFPRPGEILPPMLQQRLGLTPDQAAKVSALQKEVDSRLDDILDDEQKAQFKEMRQRGPGGRGPGAGPGGPGGPPRPPGGGLPPPPPF